MPPTPTPTPPSTPPKGPTTRPPRVNIGRRTGVPAETGWRTWWELNREHLLGIRRLLRDPGTITPSGKPIAKDALGARRGLVLEKLRKTARAGPDRTLRAAAIIALGRMGNDTDATLFLKLLRDKRQPSDVHEAAAIGIGILPRIRDKRLAAAVREYLTYLVRHAGTLPERARGLSILAAGLRARGDPLLRMELVGRAASTLQNGEEAAIVAFTCGLAGDAMVVPELTRAARKGKLGGNRLTDLERSHAVLALAMIGDGNVVRTLGDVLGSRRAGIQSRRSAALALGRMLRERELDNATVNRARRALRRTFDKEKDAILRGFAAVALGGAREPAGIPELEHAIDRGGNADVKPFCALALGLAARTLGEDDGKKIRAFLFRELKKARQLDLVESLSIALGIAKAKETADFLLKRVERRSLPASSRGAAAQGLGLMGRGPAAAGKLLEDIVRKETSPRLLEDVVLALGLMGRRGIGHELALMIPKMSSTHVQGRLMLALAHLNHGAAVEPLLDVYENRTHNVLAREFAAVALGLLGDHRDEDVLFALDAYFNFFATTRATHELVRLY